MFEELLIKEVEKHECLYKKNSISYTNKLIRHKAWNAVAIAVGDLKEHCQSRWRSLRDRYVKEVNKEDTVGTTQWKFMDDLAFLKPHFRKRQNTKHKSLYRKKQREIEFVDTRKSMTMITHLYDEEPTTSHKRKLHTLGNNSSEELEETVTSQIRTPHKIQTRTEEDDWLNILEEAYDAPCKQKSSCKVNSQTPDNVIADMLDVVDSISTDLPLLQAYSSDILYTNNTTDGDICFKMPEENIAASTKNLPRKIPAQALEDVAASKTKTTRKTQIQAMDDICSLIGTVKELVAAKCTQNSSQQKSRNSAFLSMLDDYLQKLNEEQQDVLKIELINYVVERSAEMRENLNK